MAGIDVLSNIPKGGNKVENMSSSMGRKTSGSSGNGASDFATMLTGKLKSYLNSKGQSSSKADQDVEEKTNTSPLPSGQSPDGLESLAYGNIVLPLISQVMLPAGKEANSGESMSQRIENSTGGKNLAPLLNLISQGSEEGSGSTGMTIMNPQEDNLGITELDKYRQVINKLLVELSGVITDSTPEVDLERADSMGAKDLRQELARITQGWMTMTDEAIKAELSTNAQNGLQRSVEGSALGNANPELSTKAANILAALYPLFVEGTGGEKVPQGVREALIDQLKGSGIDLDSIATASKDTLTNVLQKSEGMGLQESKNTKNFQDIFSEANKANSMKSVELFGPKDALTQSSSSEVGVVVNVVPLTLSDGKVVAIPVWEQISTVVREQVMLKQQVLKQLDIQLHPADLGKIQISLRWESGQVHMQVQASEAATGQLLQNQLSDLRQNLMNQGVNCGSLQMGQGGERQQQSQSDESQRALQQSDSLPNEDEDLIPINPLSLGQNGLNRINVTA
ncbi:flagellar hook-length control protein FliK [Desulfosporosinus fructosivorans]|uniref:Flagellar hook-length control protein FliK n=1 Tax=Desulfosporosinus fructosivorans TaxID=2018669 RepID=A0A4Z0RC17_9FIRM|nr:flagellar hook-length control protein FliK [Desulfosporosinus fructosivorans]TGE40004.1 flagellar hook-length control protein FliK [Desulfosporosinus fructosivorans]